MYTSPDNTFGKLFLFLILLHLSLPLWANPFMGGREEAGPRPVRTGAPGATSEIQFGFREKVSSLLTAVKEEPGFKILAALGGAAFLYGLLHGAGPGHRKTIVFSLLIGRKSKFYEPLAAGFLAAGVHAGVSLVLILLFRFILNSSMLINKTSQAGLYLEGGSYILLSILSFLLILRLFFQKDLHKHSSRGRGFYSMIIVSSLIPCPGATMILLFSLSLDLLIPGIFAILFMSLGMGTVISIAGFFAYWGRKGLFYRLKENQRWFSRISAILTGGSLFFILIFSLYMAWPFIVSISK